MAMSDWDASASLLEAITPPPANWEEPAHNSLPALDPPCDAQQDDGHSTVCLPADPDAHDLKELLLVTAGSGYPRIDASLVARLSGPAMQVLLVAMQDALRAGQKRRVLSPSFAFTLSFEAYGLGGTHEPFTVEYF
jgi:anti-anti-sigma regulatory factor